MDKNIHILSTDKPSKLYVRNDVTPPFYSNFQGVAHNVYITCDEKIKLNDYIIQVNFEKTNTQVIRCETESQVKIANDKNGSFTKNKITLTTDQDLIKDGVQAIDDDFLKWLIKNPNCDNIEVIKMCRTCGLEGGRGDDYCQRSKECKRNFMGDKYEIVIPTPPKTICFDCGKKDSKNVEEKAVTARMAVCDICKQKKLTTNTRHYE